MEVILLCSLLNKLQLFSRRQQFILIQILLLYVCCMFRPVLRPSSGMSIQKCYEDISFCVNIPKDSISTGRNMQHTWKDTICVKINVCCVQLNKCYFISARKLTNGLPDNIHQF